MSNFRGKTFAFLGISGSGKGTQAKLLTEYIKKQGNPVFYIYTGDLFRRLAETPSLAGSIVKKDIETGGLPADWIASFLWIRELVDNLKSRDGVIIFDGSPRRMREAQDMDEILPWFRLEKFYLIHLKLSRASAFQRLKMRGREDDTDESINRRLDWFESSVKPIVELFEKSYPERLIAIDGEKDIQSIHSDLVSKLESKF